MGMGIKKRIGWLNDLVCGLRHNDFGVVLSCHGLLLNWLWNKSKDGLVISIDSGI